MLAQMQNDIAMLQATVARLENTTIAGFSRHESRGGIAFGTTTRPNAIFQQPITVVIVVAPVAGDATLIVREAKYADLLPAPCTRDNSNPPIVTCNYTWEGLPFQVYLPLGKEAVDYAGDEQVPADDTHPPKLDSVFHRCHRENDVWVMDDIGGEGGGGFRFASVPTNRIAHEGIPPGPNCVTGASTIDVQPLKRGTGTTYTNDGAQISVRLWGNQRGEDFYTLIGDIIPIVQVGSEWFALQYFWMYAKTPTGTKGDCGL